MTVWSLCMFSFELDILEIRFATLDPVVDRHVIVEAPVTHAGDEKPMVFAENRDRYAKWAHKIRQVTDEDPPEGAWEPAGAARFAESGSDHWRREHHQRDALTRALDDAQDDDLILVSDCDEIPDPSQGWDEVQMLADAGLVVQPTLAMHCGRLRWRWPQAVPGTRTRILTGRTLRQLGGGVDAATRAPTVAGGHGWHLAYMGGVTEIQRKLASFAHQELNRPPYNQAEHIEHCLETGADLFDRDDRRSVLCAPSDLPDLTPELEAALW